MVVSVASLWHYSTASGITKWRNIKVVLLYIWKPGSGSITQDNSYYLDSGSTAKIFLNSKAKNTLTPPTFGNLLSFVLKSPRLENKRFKFVVVQFEEIITLELHFHLISFSFKNLQLVIPKLTNQWKTLLYPSQIVSCIKVFFP